MKRGTRVKSVLTLILCISLILTMFGSISVAAATREELSEAMEEAELLDEFYYQPASFEKLVKAIEGARPFLQEGYGTQEELDKSYTALMDAIVGLKLKVEKNILDASIISVGFLDKNRFQPDGWNDMVEALGKAKAISVNEASTQSQVDMAFQNLVLSISRMIQIDGKAYEPVIDYDSVSDKTILNAILYNVTLLEPEAFTEISWELFNGTLFLAQEVSADPKAKKAEVAEIQNELILAQADLERDYSYGIHEGESVEFPINVAQPNLPSYEEDFDYEYESIIDTPTEEPTTDNNEDNTPEKTENTPKKKTKKKNSSEPVGFPVLPVVMSIVGVVVIAAVVVIILIIKKKRSIKNNGKGLDS